MFRTHLFSEKKNDVVAFLQLLVSRFIAINHQLRDRQIREVLFVFGGDVTFTAAKAIGRQLASRLPWWGAPCPL